MRLALYGCVWAVSRACRSALPLGRLEASSLILDLEVNLEVNWQIQKLRDQKNHGGKTREDSVLCGEKTQCVDLVPCGCVAATALCSVTYATAFLSRLRFLVSCMYLLS